MKKFTLLTFREGKDSLMKDLQKFGDVHFRDISKADLADMEFLKHEHSPREIQRCEAESDKVAFAIGKLAPFVEKAGLTAKRPSLSYEEFDSYLDRYDYDTVCGEIKEQDDRISSLKSEIARLKAENEGLKAWESLDVSPVSLDALSSAKYLAGTVNKMAADALVQNLEKEFSEVYVELLGTFKEDMSVLILMDGDLFEDAFAMARDLGFSRANITFGDVPKSLIKRNNEKIAELQKESGQAADNIKAKNSEHGKLLIVRDCLTTLLERERAANNFMSSDAVILIEGWVPDDDNARFIEILKNNCGDNFYLEQADVEQDSTEVPIKLKNNGFVTAFESITSMYSLPRYNEFDPTPLLSPFYWAFFGLMVGDIGYGLILMLGTFIVMKTVDLNEGMKGFVKFFFLLSFAVVLGGVIYGSMFGFPVFTPLPLLDANGAQVIIDGVPQFKAILDTQYDIVTMIIASIAIGLVHVLFGVAIKGALCIKKGDIAGAIFDSLFWILSLLSGIGLILGVIPGLLPPVMAVICKWMFFGSLFGLACTQGRSSPGLGGKIGNGLFGVYGITSYVGDLVSYTRIVALALSGAYIAFSFNLMATILPPGFVRIVFGLIIMILGQTLNFGLALLGAYVHTCRLQYVEYFGKFYEGGGAPFRPLKLKHDSIHIVNQHSK